MAVERASGVASARPAPAPPPEPATAGAVEPSRESLPRGSHSLVGLAIQRSDYAGFFLRVSRGEPALRGARGEGWRLGPQDRARFEASMRTPPLVELWVLELRAGEAPGYYFAYLADDRGFPMPGMPRDADQRYFTLALARPQPGRSWELFGQFGAMSATAASGLIEELLTRVCAGNLAAGRERQAHWDGVLESEVRALGGLWLSVPAEVLGWLDSGVPPPYGFPRTEFEEGDEPEAP